METGTAENGMRWVGEWHGAMFDFVSMDSRFYCGFTDCASSSEPLDSGLAARPDVLPLVRLRVAVAWLTVYRGSAPSQR